MYSCPKDHIPLEAVRQDKQQRCSSCKGNLVISEKLFKVVQEKFHEVKTINNIQCPSCKFKMKHYRFSILHLDVDACPDCQTFWFDHGEMKDINNYIQKFHRSSKRTVGDEVAKSFKNEESKLYSKYMEHHGFEGKMSTEQVLMQIFLGLPVEHNLPPFRKPIITWLLITLNVLLFTYAFIFLNSTAIPGFELKVGEASFFSLMTGMFSHGGFMHLFGNMYMLKIHGDNVEDLFGRRNYLILYLISGLVGFLVFLALNTKGAVFGASGAVAGVMASYYYLFPKAKFSFRFFILFKFNIPAWVLAVLWVGQQFFISLGPSKVAWEAHLGGFAIGLAYAIFAKRAHLI